MGGMGVWRKKAGARLDVAKAFSLVELLVVVAVIGVLCALLVGGLGQGKERAKRTGCVNNLRQFYLATQLYAMNLEDVLPGGYSDAGEQELLALRKSGGAIASATNIDEHVPMVALTTWTNLLRENATEQVMTCPGLPAPFRKPGGMRSSGYGVVLGYNYMGGHLRTPWPTNFYAKEAWTSPLKTTADPQSVLLADLNTFTFSQVVSFIPHSSHGALLAGVYPGLKTSVALPPLNNTPPELHPAKFGGEGGNIARLDGSVRWKKMRDMTVHAGSSLYGQDGALAVW